MDLFKWRSLKLSSIVDLRLSFSFKQCLFINKTHLIIHLSYIFIWSNTKLYIYKISQTKLNLHLQQSKIFAFLLFEYMNIILAKLTKKYFCKIKCIYYRHYRFFVWQINFNAVINYCAPNYIANFINYIKINLHVWLTKFYINLTLIELALNLFIALKP